MNFLSSSRRGLFVALTDFIGLHHMCLWLLGNSQNIQTKTWRAYQPSDDMQQCHQQTEKVSKRPTLQLDQVSFLFSLFWMETPDHPIGDVKVVVLSYVYRSTQTCDKVELNLIGDLKTQIKEKENVFFDMEAYLPKRNGLVQFLPLLDV